MKLDDPIEQIVADGLDTAGIRYVHETISKDTTRALDFYLPAYDVYLECKQFWSANTYTQTSRADNIIVIQGRGAAEFFASLTGHP